MELGIRVRVQIDQRLIDMCIRIVLSHCGNPEAAESVSGELRGEKSDGEKISQVLAGFA